MPVIESVKFDALVFENRNEPQNSLTNWVEVILQKYYKLGKVCKELEQLIKYNAKSSFFAPNGTYELCGELLHMGARVKKLTKLKYVINQAIYALPPEFRDITAAKFIKRIAHSQIADKFGLAKSSVYRKLSVSKVLLVDWFAENNMNALWFKRHFGDESVFKRAFRGLSAY